MSEKFFICSNCGIKVSYSKVLGTENRNHCPACLWSRHVDEKTGDRSSSCNGKMKPLGLTFKKTRENKYGQKKVGELMLIHQCRNCGKVSLNRIAGDDNTEAILDVFNNSQGMAEEIKKNIRDYNVFLLEMRDLPEIKRQLFGKTIGFEP